MPHFIFIQQISVPNILNMLYNLHFFSSKCRLFHNATLFGFRITHTLKFEKNSVAKRLSNIPYIKWKLLNIKNKFFFYLECRYFCQ